LSESISPVSGIVIDAPARQQSARDAAVDWLMDRINYERTAVIPYQERQLKLDRMRQVLTRLGQPDAGMKIVHVAGTKGKGSTSAMISAVLTAAGYRTGVFSSPHLERIEERFAVDGKSCTAAEITALVNRLKPVVRTMDEEVTGEGEPMGGPTYFDLTTAMALLHFVEHQVDAAVLEVGLGGRLDSTNVCLPAVSVITSISFDHMKQLGNTLAAIAREKAGIIKPGVPVVCGVSEPEAQVVIAGLAREHGCRLIQIGREFGYTYHAPKGPRQGDKETGRQGDNTHISLSPSLLVSPSQEFQGSIEFSFDVTGQEHEIRDIKLAMRGPHQGLNAAVALATIAELRHQGWCVSADAVRLGMSRAMLPGRVELVSVEPTIVIDTAHNAASAHALVEALAEFQSPARRTVVLSISRDKDVRAVLQELVPHFDRFILTQYQENPRAVSADGLAEILREVLAGRPGEVILCPTPALAWQHVRQTLVQRELLCITGSFYLAAEMRPFMHGERLG
jgi:dihydrofolate synthase/folylpolyglutamate synthase